MSDLGIEIDLNLNSIHQWHTEDDAAGEQRVMISRIF